MQQKKEREHVRGAALQTPWSVEEREEVLEGLEPVVLTWSDSCPHVGPWRFRDPPADP